MREYNIDLVNNFIEGLKAILTEDQCVFIKNNMFRFTPTNMAKVLGVKRADVIKFLLSIYYKNHVTRTTS